MSETWIPIDANVRNRLDNAIRAVEEARRALTALYLATRPEDPAYERAVAETIVPVHLRPLSDHLHTAYEFLLNLRDIDFDVD
jgi:hypothetical protein